MMGNDLDRINSVLNKLKDEIAKQIHLLARESDHRLETIEHSHNVLAINGGHGDAIGLPQEHTHAVPGVAGPTGASGSDGNVSKQLTYSAEYSNDKHEHHKHVEPYIIYEREHPVQASTYINPIISIGDEMWEDGKKMQKIEKEMYTEKETFNNTYGSPYQEIYILKEKLDELKQYASDYPNLQWLGEKQSLLSLMNMVLTFTVDAKWACTINHDFIQRGYDSEFNDNNPSITLEDFKGETIGNVEQYIPDKVNLNRNLDIETIKSFFGDNFNLDKIKGMFDPF
jgi:hypothetical protein